MQEDELREARHEAVRVLTEEARALDRLAQSLDASFDQAVRRVSEVRGRVVLTGMGKSGHIAAKIAATLASTGTPAFFVHPGEASHGDLGMITSDDLVIALSHTGGTTELGDVVAYCQTHGILLIGLTSKADSLLGSQADLVLLTGVDKEACPIELAPMSSTTASLALGDALAAALMRLKRFAPNDFAVFHPGGRLGSRLVTVNKLMHSDEALPLVPPGLKMAEALLVMNAKRLGHLLVVDAAGVLLGIITDGDLRRHMGAELLERPVTEVMTANPVTITPDLLAIRAMEIMEERPAGSITALPVVENGRVVGLLHIHDCLARGIV